MKQIELKYIDHSIAYFCYNDKNEQYIEVNKHLLKYPKLFGQVLQHELEHYRLFLKKGPHKMDFWHDFKSMFNIPYQIKLSLFSIRHPKTLMCYSPIFYEKGDWCLNYFAIINIILCMLLIYLF